MLYVIVSFGLFFKKEHVCTDLCCSRNRCNNQIPGVNKTVIIVKVYIDLMKKNHHQQNQQHLRLDEIFAFGSHVCFDLRFWFWMLDVHIIQQISVINCRIANVAYYKGMSSFFSNSHTVATRASAHFCGIFTAAPASHNSAPLVSPYILLVVLILIVFQSYILAWPPSLYSVQCIWPIHLTKHGLHKWARAEKWPPLQFWRGVKKEGAGVWWGKKSALHTHQVLDMRPRWCPATWVRTMSRLIATVSTHNNKKGSIFTLHFCWWGALLSYMIC